MHISDIKKAFSKNKDAYLDQLAKYISFKSVGTDAQYQQDCLDCADWLETHLNQIGFKTEKINTKGLPVVYAEYFQSEELPTILVYGHYDVQPAEFDSDWDNDPFIMTLKGDDFYARGAGDNKGQTFYIIKALEYLIQNKQLSTNIKLFIEGEEEFASPNTIPLIPDVAKKISADALLICDDLMFSEDQPVISIGMRGVMGLNIRLSGPNGDLHSGLFGGLIKNPAKELVQLLAKLHNPDGTIAVPGFYDNVSPISDLDRKMLESLPQKPGQSEAIGMPINGSEEGYEPLVSNMFRPTIEINGIKSGYSGPGSKSIIPSDAKANISCRTVVGQDPERLMQAIKKILTENCPKDLKLSFEFEEPGCSGFIAREEGPALKYAQKIMNELFKKPCLYYASPATIPIIPHLYQHAAKDIIVTGFGLETDSWHGPNELFSISRFETGFIFSCLFFAGFAKAT